MSAPAAPTPRHVLLTGASAGIGRETAGALLGAGCEVWGTSRQRSRLPDLGPKFHPVELEQTSGASRRSAWAQVEKECGGRLDALVNNAGEGVFGAFADEGEDVDGLRAQFETLVFGPIGLTRCALPALHRAPRPVVVNVTSLAGRLPIPFMAAYSAGKAALSAYTAALRLEATDVRWVDVQPGDIRTKFNDAMRAPPADSGPQRRSWDVMEASMAAAPPAEVVARAIVEIVCGEGTPPPVVVVGDFVQAKLASLAPRFLPTRWLESMLRRHYRV